MNGIILAILAASYTWTGSENVNETNSLVVTDEIAERAGVLGNLNRKTTVYRLELTDETPFIVGEDGVRRQVAIVDPDKYNLLTGRFEKVWANMNSTESGREKLHGKKVETKVDTNTLTKTTVYSDGFCHAESFEIRTAPVMQKFAGVKNRTNMESKKLTEKPAGMSDKRWEMRQAYMRRLNKKAKEVFVEHNAATGKDVVK